MRIKDFKKKLKEEEYNIPNVLPKIQKEAYAKNFSTRTSSNPSPKSLRKSYALRLSSVILIGIMVIGLVFGLGIASQNKMKNRMDFGNIKVVTSNTDLNQILLNSEQYSKVQYTFLEKVGNFVSRFMCAKDDVFESNSSSIPPTENMLPEDNFDQSHLDSVDSSGQMNNQVSNVIENDIVKVDDTYIYHYFYHTLYIYKKDGTSFSLYKSFEYSDEQMEYNKASLQLHQNYVILFYEYGTPTVTKVYIYDKEQDFNLVKTYEVVGSIIDTRLMKNCFYIFTQDNIMLNQPHLPYYKIDGKQEEIALKQVKYVDNALNEGYTILSTIELKEELKIHQSIQLGASHWNVVYASENHIYLASSIFSGKRRKVETTVYQYKIEQGTTILDGFCQADGYITDQYSIDEYKSYLRVAFVDTRNKNPLRYNSLRIYSVTNIDKETKKMKMVGSLEEGLGKEYQTIRAVRFNKEHASVVTYLNKDPLYDVDLSNPENPKIVGTYESMGYSSYLHLFNDTTLLGIGFTDERSPKLSLYQLEEKDGIKVSTQLGEDFIFGKEDSDLISVRYAFEKPRELFVSNQKMIIGIPFIQHRKTGIFYEYSIFQMDLTNSTHPIQLVKSLKGEELWELEKGESYSNFTILSDWTQCDYENPFCQSVITRVVYTNSSYVAITGKGLILLDKEFNYIQRISNQSNNENKKG